MSTWQLPLRLRGTLERRASAVPQAWRQPLAIAGMLVAGAWIVVAIFAPLIAPYDPLAQTSNLVQDPSSAHLFGTDELGRDVFSRVLWGSRYSIPIAFALVIGAVTIGGLLGGLAGYFGGWVDEVVMRAADLVFAFPTIILAMAVTAALGPSLEHAVLAILIVFWPSYARVVRGLVMSLKEADYVNAARLLGSTPRRALAIDVLPNVAGPVLVLATLDLGNAVLLLAALSFLGLGIQPPTPEWGAMVNTGTAYFPRWWMGTFPGFAIMSVVLAFNFLGDSLRDALDPRSSWGGKP